jgi:phosphatidylglycerol lysyltransferase
LTRFYQPLGILAVGAGLLLVLGHDIAAIHYDAMLSTLFHMRPSILVLAAAGTLLSFVALVARDAFAIGYIRERVPFTASLLSGFCANAVGHSIGFAPLTKATIRYRIYRAFGVSTEEIARLLLFISAGFTLGVAGVAGVAGLVEAQNVGKLINLPPDWVRALSIGILALTLAVIFASSNRTLRILQFEIASPKPAVAGAQLILAAIRLTGAALTLWVLLPKTSVGFFSFVAVFSAASAAGAFSAIPGGLGVFEAIVILVLGQHASKTDIAAALVVYRFIYFVIPLLLAMALLAAFELGLPFFGEKRERDPLVQAAQRLAPLLLGGFAFAIGVMLLISGATPAFEGRLLLLERLAPLWLVEAANFSGGLVGVSMLFLAQGLLHRRRAAWWLALSLASFEIAMSFAKGLAYSEAGVLFVFVVLLMATKSQFRASALMLDRPFSPNWLAAIGVVLMGAFGIYFFAFRQALTSGHDAWLDFGFYAQAPRALRALSGASVLALGWGLWALLRPPNGRFVAPDAAALDRAERILADQSQSAAYLALMGDKGLLFSRSGRSFLMYGKKGRSWIALFDPVGPACESKELIERFIALASQHGGRAAFYQVPPESLRAYLDAGLSVVKLGEEAVVDLGGFDLSASRFKSLRYSAKRGARDGLSFELFAPDQNAAVLADVERISERWVAGKKIPEKGFSVAAFDLDYVRRQWIGLVCQAGAPVAFVSVMASADGANATAGLMRYVDEKSPYTMEFMFINLLQAFKERGFQSFSMGVAPLSGVEAGPLSSFWHRIGSLAWRHGKQFYNFEGLRLFKDKFGPEWAPRYLAVSGALGPYAAIADILGLISKSRRDRESRA